jgi:topoisomerase-4 subunit A
MIDNPNKEEKFISEHPDSQLQIVAVDYRPVAEIIFSKKSLENRIINFEEFISIKGIKSLGNQLTADKIKQINLLDPLPYEAPEIKEVEVIEEEIVDNQPLQDSENKKDEDPPTEEDGQIVLF